MLVGKRTLGRWAAGLAMLTIALQAPVAFAEGEIDPVHETTTNWAGYVASGGNFSEVEGAWQVPTYGFSFTNGHASQWIGIGGYGGEPTLVQIGTAADYLPWSTGLSTYAWVEILPSMPVLRKVDLTVRPGDMMAANIRQADGQWQLAIANATTGQIVTDTESQAVNGATAEWICETPTYTGGSRSSLYYPALTQSPTPFFASKATREGQAATAGQLGATGLTLIGQTLGRPIVTVTPLRDAAFTCLPTGKS